MSVKMFLMWNSKLLIDGGGDVTVATSLLEASNLVVLKVLYQLAVSKTVLNNEFMYYKPSLYMTGIICHTL